MLHTWYKLYIQHVNYPFFAGTKSVSTIDCSLMSALNGVSHFKDPDDAAKFFQVRVSCIKCEHITVIIYSLFEYNNLFTISKSE